MNTRHKIATLLVVAAASVGAAFAYAWEPAIAALLAPPPPGGDQALLVRGLHVASTGDCMVRHTAANGKPSRAACRQHALRHDLQHQHHARRRDRHRHRVARGLARASVSGVSRDGHLLYPVSSLCHFTRMSDDDIGALYAYLMARTPVHAPARANQLTSPARLRPLVAGWNPLFLQKGPLPAPGTAQSDEWLRGRYLVEAGGAPRGLPHADEPARRREEQPALRGQPDRRLGGAAAECAGQRAQRRWANEQLVSYLRNGLGSEYGAAARGRCCR